MKPNLCISFANEKCVLWSGERIRNKRKGKPTQLFILCLSVTQAIDQSLQFSFHSPANVREKKYCCELLLPVQLAAFTWAIDHNAQRSVLYFNSIFIYIKRRTGQPELQMRELELYNFTDPSQASKALERNVLCFSSHLLPYQKNTIDEDYIWSKR